MGDSIDEEWERLKHGPEPTMQIGKTRDGRWAFVISAIIDGQINVLSVGAEDTKAEAIARGDQEMVTKPWLSA